MAKTCAACLSALLLHVSVAFRPETVFNVARRAGRLHPISREQHEVGRAEHLGKLQEYKDVPAQDVGQLQEHKDVIKSVLVDQAVGEQKVGETNLSVVASQANHRALVDWETARNMSSATARDQQGGAVLAEIGPPTLWGAKISSFGHIFAGVTIAVVVKILCMVGNVLVQVSPMPQVQDWQGKGSTGNAESAPYVAMALGGTQWCTYGMAAWIMSKNVGFLVLVYANCLGAVLGCYYTLVFFRNCKNSAAARNLRYYLLAAVFLGVAQSCMWLSVPPARALVLHSFIAGGCSFINAASLLASLPEVLLTGDSAGICGPLVLANFAGSFLWAYWGLLMDDPVIIAANSFAALSSSICLYIKFFYRAADPADKLHAPEPKVSRQRSRS